MTHPVWPSELPRPTRAGYQAQHDDGRRRRHAGGPPSYRRRFSSTAEMITLTIEVPRSKKAVFDQFFEMQTGNGTLPFWMPDPTTDGWALLASDGSAVLTDDGTPILLSAQWLCLFGDALPTETIVNAQFAISFTVAVMP